MLKRCKNCTYSTVPTPLVPSHQGGSKPYVCTKNKCYVKPNGFCNKHIFKNGIKVEEGPKYVK